MFVDAGDVDDAATVTGSDHRPDRALAGQERSGQVRGQNVVPPLEVEVDDALRMARSGDVDQYAYPAEVIDQGVNGCSGILTGGFERCRDAVSPTVFDLPSRGDSASGVGVHGQADVETVGGEPQRGRPTMRESAPVTMASRGKVPAMRSPSHESEWLVVPVTRGGRRLR